MGRSITYLFLFLILTSYVMAQVVPVPPTTITPPEINDATKAYLDAQNQKLSAQIQTKIDVQTKKIEDSMSIAVERARADMVAEINAKMKEAMMSVAIGLAGLMIVSLAVFKIIDLKINSTRAIQKYEKELQDKSKQYDDTLKSVIQLQEDLVRYREVLNTYKLWVDEEAKKIGLKADVKTLTDEKKPHPNLVTKIVIVLIIIISIGILVAKFVFKVL